MSARDARLLRAYLGANSLTTVQAARLAGVTTKHCQDVLDGRAAPEPALERLLATVDLRTVAKVLTAEEGPMAPVASIAPTSPIAAAMAEVQLALQAEADESRDLARSVTEAAQRYAAVVEGGIAHRMLAGVGRARAEDAPDVQGAALGLLDAVQRIPELAGLLDAAVSTPASTPAPSFPAAPAPQPSLEELADEIAGPAPAPMEAFVEVDPTDERPTGLGSPWPLLTLASRERRLLIVGGTPNAQALAELRAYGLVVEWSHFTGSTGGDRQFSSMLSRLRRGNAAGLIFMKGCLRHKSAVALAAAALEGRVPTSNAGTSSRTAMSIALDGLESSLRSAPRRKAG